MTGHIHIGIQHSKSFCGTWLVVSFTRYKYSKYMYNLVLDALAHPCPTMYCIPQVKYYMHKTRNKVLSCNVYLLSGYLITRHFTFPQIRNLTSLSNPPTQTETSNSLLNEDLGGRGGCKEGEAVPSICDTPNNKSRAC